MKLACCCHNTQNAPTELSWPGWHECVVPGLATIGAAVVRSVSALNDVQSESFGDELFSAASACKFMLAS